MRFTLLRRVSLTTVALLAVLGLLLNTGTGTPSSFGWREIAMICPLGAIEVFLAEKTLLPRTLIILIVIFVMVVVLGKVFCAWICPIPSLRRLLPFRKTTAAKRKGGSSAKVSGATAKTSNTSAKVSGANSLNRITDSSEHPSTPGCASCIEKRTKLDSRHMVLGGALLSTAIFGFPVFCILCPVGLSFATLIALWRWVGFDELTLSLLVFPAILLIEIIVLRSWCLKWCPLGAIMSLMSLPNRLLRPQVSKSKCLRSQGDDCSICVSVCEERLDPHFTEGMHECTKCGRCVDECPSGALSIPLSKN